ncbi:hypothetical protein L917_18578 [Phytophthora nicotianae]|uniref:Uncharacterized protein n=1 Tax=Phytophthora nicotianae TaxID=4792 RepID=W2K9F0_PHYNI|nr:hypothetical protein L917_18578 [Phytophthora nicotianae]
MFEVQLVRQRRVGRGLQALRRRFSLAVSGLCLTITAGSSSPSSAAVFNISRDRIKSVRVRGRLLRVVMANNDALTVRLRDQEETLRTAEVMMETWGVDPLVEVSAAETEEIGVEGLVKYYVNEPNFRQSIHQIHDHIDNVLASDPLNYEGYDTRM